MARIAASEGIAHGLQKRARLGNKVQHKRRIAVVGPFPPTKSGVARHTAALTRALAQGNEVRIWSFKRLYPSFLYPGASESSDDFAPQPMVAETVLDGSNPLTWEKALRQMREWKPDLLVMPAWTFFIAPALGWIAKRSGVETCMIVHNASDHEVAGWKTRLSLWQLAQADRFVTHNSALAEQIKGHFPDCVVGVFPHPIFDDFPAPVGSRPREAGLELLFFGLVRPYKGLDLLVEAFAKADRQDARLTIVGEFWSGLGALESRIAELGLGARIEVVPRFVSDADAAEYFARSDVVVLPYRSVTGSGVIPTAYHYGRAVLASNLPGLAEVIRDGETGWLVPPEDAVALAHCIAGLKRAETDVVGAAARDFGRTLSWERFAEIVAP